MKKPFLNVSKIIKRKNKKSRKKLKKYIKEVEDATNTRN